MNPAVQELRRVDISRYAVELLLVILTLFAPRNRLFKCIYVYEYNAFI